MLCYDTGTPPTGVLIVTSRTVSASLPTEVWANLPLQTHPLGERRSTVSHDAQWSPTAKPHVGPHMSYAGLASYCKRVTDWHVVVTPSSSVILLPCMSTSQRPSSRRGRTRFKPSIRKPSLVKFLSCSAPHTASWAAWQTETCVSLMSVRLIPGATSSSMVLRRYALGPGGGKTEPGILSLAIFIDCS